MSELVLAYRGWRRASATTASAPTTPMPVTDTQGTRTQSNKRTLVQKNRVAGRSLCECRFLFVPPLPAP